MKKFRSRIRGGLNSLYLNSVTTTILDRIWSLESFGARGEKEAERFLLRSGLMIVGKGYSNDFGEIDLIAVDDDTVVFVEVKTRASDIAGVPADAVDETKQEKITRTAVSYLKRHDLLNSRVRFDVISVTWPSKKNRPIIEHFKDAFESQGSNW